MCMCVYEYMFVCVMSKYFCIYNFKSTFLKSIFYARILQMCLLLSTMKTIIPLFNVLRKCITKYVAW